MDKDHTPDVETKPTRCWCTQKRRILLLVVAILFSIGIYRGVYWCLLPQPLQMSSVMCDSGEPLLPDGTPDYYAALVQRMAHIDGIKVSADADKAIHEMMSSDQNGFRDFLAALGPGLLVPDPSHSLQDAGGWGVPWNEWATNPRTKPYDETYWRPACEQLDVDPNAEPRLYAYRSFEPSCVYVNRSESATDSTTSSDEWVDIGPKLSGSTYVSESRACSHKNEQIKYYLFDLFQPY